MTALASPSRLLARFVHAGTRYAASALRDRGVGVVHAQWQARAELCERCPMRIVKCGKSYCGKPFLDLPDRDELENGCGCPTQKKARDPSAHCVRTSRFQLPQIDGDRCDCHWCSSLR